MRSDEGSGRSTQLPEGKVVENVISIPPFHRVPGVESVRDARCRPGPHVPRLVVEGPEHRLGQERGIERDDVPDRADPAIRPTRTPEEGLLGIPDQASGPQCGDAFSFDGSPIRLPLVSVERPAVVGDLERDPHAKEYPSLDISSGCAAPDADRVGRAEERRQRRSRCASDEEL